MLLLLSMMQLMTMMLLFTADLFLQKKNEKSRTGCTSAKSNHLLPGFGAARLISQLKTGLAKKPTSVVSSSSFNVVKVKNSFKQNSS